MTTDEIEIRDVLKRYFDGLYHGDMPMLASTFHPACRLFTVANGDVATVDYEPYMERCAGRAVPAASGAAQMAEVVELTVTSTDTAHARVRDAFPPRTFINELSFAKTRNGGWQIVSKVYHAFD